MVPTVTLTPKAPMVTTTSMATTESMVPMASMAPSASTNSLPWPNWNQMSDSTRKMLYQIYKNQGFCFETRLQLSDFLQNNFTLAEPGKMLACKLATQLLQEMESYIKGLPKRSTFVTIKSTMRQTLKNLKEKHSSADDGKLDLYKIVHTSLMQEKELVYKHANGPYKEIKEKTSTLIAKVEEIEDEKYKIEQEEERKATEDYEIQEMELNLNRSLKNGPECKSGTMRRPSPYASSKDINDPKKKLETLRRNSVLKQKALQNGKA